MKRLRQAVDQMAREYELSKDVDAVRRYGQLKRVIKRAIMHLKLHQSNTVDDQHMAVAVGTAAVRGKDEQRKRADHATGERENIATGRTRPKDIELVPHLTG